MDRPNDFIQHVFQTLPLLKGNEAKISINMLFDEYFGLHRYASGRPLAMVAIHPLEQYGRGGGLYQKMELYARSGIKEIFPGVSVLDFLKLPREMCDHILEISERVRSAEQASQESILAQLQVRPAGAQKKKR